MSNKPSAKRRMVSLTHVAGCALAINAMSIVMDAIGTIHVETLSAALYWPWATFLIIAITSPKPTE